MTLIGPNWVGKITLLRIASGLLRPERGEMQRVDLAGLEELFALITGIRYERRRGVLMVSHDLSLVMNSTDRVVCLNRTVCCTLAPLAVSSDPAGRRPVAVRLRTRSLPTHSRSIGKQGMV